jgi:hypothetical protein
VRIEFDPATDAAAIEWAPRACGESQVVGRPGGRGVRLYFDAAGDVVGLDVLGWSRRADAPHDVQVVFHNVPAARAPSGDNPPPRTRAEAPSVTTDEWHRPLRHGAPMLSLKEAASGLGRERSSVSREMAAGRLRALKIGRGWWTTPEWVQEYLRARANARPVRGGPGASARPRTSRPAGGRAPPRSTA